MIEGVEPVTVGEQAQTRLWEERSARFVSWVMLDDQPLTAAYVQAIGVTDFRRLQTRCDQRLGAAIFEDGRDQVRRSRNLLDRVGLMGTMGLLRLTRLEQIRHYFYADGLCWQLFRGHWALTIKDPPKPGFRAGRDRR